ncbi:hypothetical protein [Bacterioplanoides sp.]|uniref:hypothetical protein n=1 Tax=Bacterioplanoides sp. TaxID=2066072 RepID=UPI003B58FFF3
MIQIGNTSVWLTDGIIRCELYTGDVHGNFSVKQKLISTNEMASNRIVLKTNKGEGYIHFNESSTGNYTVELVLPRFFGRHRFYGSSSAVQVETILNQLSRYNQCKSD